MIYTLGCSMTKWYWPTWSDWLSAYGESVTNWAFKGYGNSNFYWNLLDKVDTITPDDHVIIAWTQNHRVNVWYDRRWADENDVLGFFPDTKGQLWYTNNVPYTGMYRTHPEYQTSFTNMIIDQLQTMLNTQLLLEKIGCKYTMFTICSPWWDGRPTFTPKFQTTWQHLRQAKAIEIEIANDIIGIPPVNNLLKQIDWSNYANAPSDPSNPKDYKGIWEYYIGNKEYVMLSHQTDHHPNSLAHHDFLLEVILKQDSKQGKHRALARQIAEDAISMPIPEFTAGDFVADISTELLDTKYKNMLENLN